MGSNSYRRGIRTFLFSIKNNYGQTESCITKHFDIMKITILFSLLCLTIMTKAQTFEVQVVNGTCHIENLDGTTLVNLPPNQGKGYTFEFIGNCWTHKTPRLPIQQNYSFPIEEEEFVIRRVLWLKLNGFWQQQSSQCYQLVTNLTNVDTVTLQPIVVNVPQSNYYVTWYDVSIHNDNIVFDAIPNKCPVDASEHLLIVYSSTGIQLNHPYPPTQLFYTRVVDWDGHFYVQSGSVNNY